MNPPLSYDAIVFPADGRPPHLVPLSITPVIHRDPFTGELELVSAMPHPEVFMDNIADDLDKRVWQWEVNI